MVAPRTHNRAGQEVVGLVGAALAQVLAPLMQDGLRLSERLRGDEWLMKAAVSLAAEEDLSEIRAVAEHG